MYILPSTIYLVQGRGKKDNLLVSGFGCQFIAKNTKYSIIKYTGACLYSKSKNYLKEVDSTGKDACKSCKNGLLKHYSTLFDVRNPLFCPYRW